MKIIDLPLIKRIREQANSVCEGCGQWARHSLEVHHLWTRGAGRLDIAINLIALGVAFDCNCHGAAQEMPGDEGMIFRELLKLKVAMRERTTVTAMEAEIFRLRNLCKYAEVVNEESQKAKPRRSAH